MRTTLNIDADVLQAARGLAVRDRKSVGEVVSELARKGLAPANTAPLYRNGIRLMPIRPGSGVVTNELIDRLREEFE